ncbi:PIR protein [Plasmodium ovale]|uniref:PIR protein n=1 Tax=Plasmodium ovale TaxID=36330 RepID=A0A1C3KJK0_PLAOA|nr:PIR protein [Plasmodium ovale]
MADINDEKLFRSSIFNYDRLDKYYKSHGNDEICRGVEEKLTNYHEIKKFCMNLTGIFKKYDELSLLNTSDDDHCTIVKYWIYDRLFNKIFDESKENKISDIIPVLISIRDKYPKVKECDLFNYPTNKDDFNIIKKLYDYATDYNTVSLYLVTKGNICRENMNTYANDNDELYKKVKLECEIPNPNKAYCHIFNNMHKGKIKENLSKKLICLRVESQDSVVPGQSEDVGDDHVEYVEVQDGAHVGMRVANSQSSGTVEHPSPSTSKEETSVQSSASIITIVLPLLGIILIFFILNKFTPFGTWLRVHVLKDKSIKRDLSLEHPFELLTNEHEHIDISNQESKHVLGYHAS